MPKFRVSVTSTDQGNKTVAEAIVEKVGREHALVEGIAELLRGPQFPPDIGQFYEGGMMRAQNAVERSDVIELMLEKFHLQVWVKESEEEMAAAAQPPAVEMRPAASSTPAATVSLNGKSIADNRLSPRALVKHRLRALRRELAEVEPRYKQVKREIAEAEGLLRK